MNQPSASTDRAGESILSAIWRPAGVIYLAVLVAATAAGFWPDAIYRPKVHYEIATQPALQTLAVGQVGFILLIYPLILFARRRRGQMRRYVAEAAIEAIGMGLVAVPFYAVAAYVANAAVGDVIRTVAYVACLLPLAWTAGALMARSKELRPWVMICMCAITLGLPAAWYIAREFLALDPSHWLWKLAPVTFIWDAATPRLDTLLPEPLWALCVWLAAGACGLLLRLANMAQKKS